MSVTIIYFTLSETWSTWIINIIFKFFILKTTSNALHLSEVLTHPNWKLWAIISMSWEFHGCHENFLAQNVFQISVSLYKVCIWMILQNLQINFQDRTSYHNFFFYKVQGLTDRILFYLWLLFWKTLRNKIIVVIFFWHGSIREA